MNTYYKAVRPDGGSFRDPNFKWATEPGEVTTHPAPIFGETDAAHYLSVATVATDCTGTAWPCRLLEVEPVGETWVPDAEALPNKVAGAAFRTVRELSAHEVFGPQGVEVVALIERAERLTRDEAILVSAARYAARYAARDAAWDAAWYAARYAARDAARDVAWYAARDVAWDAARDAARDAAWDAAWDAVVALLVRDLISEEHFNVLYGPWASVMDAARGGEQ